MPLSIRPTSPLVRGSLAVACATLLAACGGTSADDAATTTADPGPFLDTKVVAVAITDSIREQRNATAEVDCPEQVRQAKGVTFVCEATTRDGRTAFVVTQRDAEGNVDYVAADEEDDAAE